MECVTFNFLNFRLGQSYVLTLFYFLKLIFGISKAADSLFLLSNRMFLIKLHHALMFQQILHIQFLGGHLASATKLYFREMKINLQYLQGASCQT